MRVVVLKPIISEKSMQLVKNSLYTFATSLDATKPEVKRWVEEKFSVDVIGVKTINISGKRKMQKSRRGFYTASPLRKAIVKVKKGQTIPVFEAASKEDVQVTTVEGEEVATATEKKSFLRRTKVRIEKAAKPSKEEALEKEGKRGQVDLKSSHKEKKKGGR